MVLEIYTTREEPYFLGGVFDKTSALLGYKPKPVSGDYY